MSISAIIPIPSGHSPRVLLGNLVQSKSMKTHSSIPVTRGGAREARV